MLYLHHRVDEDTNYVVDTSDWTMNLINDGTAEEYGVEDKCPSADALDTEDTTVAAFYDFFHSTGEIDVNAYFMEHELYPLTAYLALQMDTYLRFDAKIDIWEMEDCLFCRGYTEGGLCICWYTDGEIIDFFSFSGLDINAPFVAPVEDLQAALGHSLWDGQGMAGVFYTPAKSKIAFVRYMDSAGICKSDLQLFDWGKEDFLYE